MLVRSAPLAVLFLAMPAAGQPAASKDPTDQIEALDQFQGVTEQFKKLGDWAPHAEIIRGVLERTWEENGWNSDADQFARSAALEVSKLPPWDFQGRVEKMTELVGERYQFGDAQKGRFQATIYSETGWFLAKNFKAVVGQTQETISARAEGKPFTSEQVARWTRESEDMTADARERVERIAQSMEKTMTPEQRGLLQQDMESYQRRRAHLDQLRQRWARGEWRPEDWGLQQDPIQNQGLSRTPQPSSQPASQPAAAIRTDRLAAPLAIGHDETTWERYVREFIERFRLDAAQRESALSMLRELEARAGAYRTSHRAELAGIPANELAAHRQTAPLRRMFEELCARLEPIPTAAQRAAAQQAAAGSRRP